MKPPAEESGLRGGCGHKTRARKVRGPAGSSKAPNAGEAAALRGVSGAGGLAEPACAGRQGPRPGPRCPTRCVSGTLWS